MAQVQVKNHGQVTNTPYRSMTKAREAFIEYAKVVKQSDYLTLVGSAPDLALFVCNKHADNLPADADFCYIVAANKG